MTRKPTSAADAQTMRVVIVTMDSHLAGAAARANRLLAKRLPGVQLVVHAASEWAEDTSSLARCIADIGTADIVLAAMLFMEEHFLPVLPALKARRDACDAMVCIMSAAEVMKLTRLGRFTMDGTTRGPMAFLKKLRGKSSEGKPAATAGAQQMKMLRRLPKILRFIPGTAQDVRAYFLTLQYWLAGSEDNIVQMVQLLVDRYADGPRIGLRGQAKVLPPAEYPEVGIYHPAMEPRLSAQLSDLPRVATTGKRGTVGLLLMRSYLLAGNAKHYDGVITAMEARGLRVVPAFASSSPMALKIDSALRSLSLARSITALRSGAWAPSRGVRSTTSSAPTTAP